MDQFEQALLAAELDQGPVQRVFGGAVFFPGKIIFFRRLDGAVAQPLGIVPRHDDLHGGEKVLDEDFFLVVQVLLDALSHGNRRAFQLQHAERDAVDVQHHVGLFGVRFGVGRRDGDFLGNREVVSLGPLPVDEPDGFRVLTNIRLDLHAIAEQVVDGAVAVVEAFARIVGRPVEREQRPSDQRVVVPLLFQERAQQLRLDTSVVFAVGPVTEIVVTQHVAQQLHDAHLGSLLDLPDSHGRSPVMMIRPIGRISRSGPIGPIPPPAYPCTPGNPSSPRTARRSLSPGAQRVRP